MTKCRLCGGLGWFFNLNENDLCSNCVRMATMEVDLRKKALADASKRVDDTLNPHSKIMGLDLVEENLEALSKFEEKGVPTIGSSPSDMLHKTRQQRKELIVDTAMTEFKALLSKADKTAALDDRRRLYSDFLLRLEEYRKKSGELWFFNELSTAVRQSLHQIQLNAILEKAAGVEKGGEKPKALELYLEAWSFINKASIAPAVRRTQTAKLNSKIIQLGGKPPKGGARGR